MNEEDLNSFRQLVCNMITTLGMPPIDGDELDEFTFRTGHANIKGVACLESCSLIFQEDKDGMSSPKTPPRTPPSADTSDVLRTSSRTERRSYKRMQSRSYEGSRKKFKCTVRENSHTVPTEEVIPTEVIQNPVNNTTHVGPSTKSCPETTAEMTVMSAKDQLNNQTPTSGPTITECFETPTGSLQPDKDTGVRRLVLDGSGSSLENVLEALKTQNTDRIVDSAVSDKYAVLTNTEPMGFQRIITSIGMNCVNTILTSLASAVEIEKERLQEYKRKRLSQIKQDQKQMNLPFTARSKREEQYREEEERLLKETETAIACLSMRDIADRDLRDVLSEPTELIGEFKEDDIEKVIRDVDRDNAFDAKRRSRAAVKETYYWDIIKARASMIGPLPGSSGKKTGVTSQEKSAAKRLVIALGYAHSRDSILKARSYLKLLSDLRETGVTLLLLYRTKEFKTHFLRHPNEIAMVLSWNQLYHPCLCQLRLRAIAQAEGDFSGQCDLEDQDVLHRLHIPQGVIWGNDLSEWWDSTEKESYIAGQSIKPASGKSNAYILRYGIKDDIDSNKSIYINMIPYEGISGKRTLGGKSPSTKLLAISPLVSISPGEFLGIFPGRLRYTEIRPAGAIQGPAQGLWLDRTDVKGKLHWIKAAKSGEPTNVCLVWEGVNEDKGAESCCQYWRILVIATRHIRPFDQLVRPAFPAIESSV